MKDENGIVEASLQTDTIKIVKNAEILEDMTGTFEYVGTAAVGQQFAIVGEIENYFQVKFGRGIGFIHKEDAEKVLNDNNLRAATQLTNDSFITTSDVLVYDAEASYFEEIGLIKENMRFPIVRETDKWYVIDFMGRQGCVMKEQVTKDEGIVAIMYHHFLKKEENKVYIGASTTIQPSEFEWQMNYLKDNGFVTIDMNTFESYITNKSTFQRRQL